jgi:hypothetical protein
MPPSRPAALVSAAAVVVVAVEEPLTGYWAPLAPRVELEPVKPTSASAVSPAVEAEQLAVPAPAGAGLPATVTGAARAGHRGGGKSHGQSRGHDHGEHATPAPDEPTDPALSCHGLSPYQVTAGPGHGEADSRTQGISGCYLLFPPSDKIPAANHQLTGGKLWLSAWRYLDHYDNVSALIKQRNQIACQQISDESHSPSLDDSGGGHAGRLA